MSEKKIAFIGAGLIGSGLALNCITHGIPVSLQTRSKVDLCRSRMENGLQFFIDKKIISEEEAEKARGLYTITTSIEEALQDVFMVQESGPDSVELKHNLVAEIEKYVADDVIIASSTSSRSITEVFEKAAHPERCMGGHPYNPSYLIPLVEITKGEKTGDAYVAKAKEIYEKMGKTPVVLNKESIGFIANRYQSAIHREAVDLVENGVCSVEDADKALMYGVGLRWSVVGQFLSLHLGVAPEGIGSFNEKFHVDVTQPDYRLSHMPTWTTFPAQWCEHAQAGLEEAIANRPEETGRDIASIEKWRDDMLVETLRLHDML
ncbi:MAG: 3-hydroxyacyl-CoA dehydrogenase family protein [Lachnospiraceae bacterium]|nr:3-hydroxyacyl-CoA dehydrogenase family protein [Lachnospiraceae bacterium]